MSAIRQPLVEESYREYEKTRYREFLHTLSDSIAFEQDTWICRNRRRVASEGLHLVSIYFSKVPERYREMVKYYTILRIISGRAIRTVRSAIINLSAFLRFVGNDSLDSINVITAMLLKEHLDNCGYAESYCYAIWSEAGNFLSVMNGFDGMQLKNPFYKNIYESHQQLDYKYIPDSVVAQLDYAFMDSSILLHLRCIYWILRLIPSRINEVLGMSLDCLKPFDGHFCLFIPTWKQNGGYMEPIMRVIHIIDDDGMGGYFLRLIREQQKTAKSYQIFLPKGKENMLFSYRREARFKSGTCLTDSYSVISWRYVSTRFKEICTQFNIREEDGKPYNATTHQFRHNGITDRLAEGFTAEQIAEMTGHHGSATIYGAYTHLNLMPEVLRKPYNYNGPLKEPKNPYVLFSGRILNMDARMEAYLLKNIRAHRVRGGICDDITHCSSDMWVCFNCGHFIPEREQLGWFEEQVELWQVKAERFAHEPLIRENALKNLAAFNAVVHKLKADGGEERG
jgi:integrase